MIFLQYQEIHVANDLFSFFCSRSRSFSPGGGRGGGGDRGGRGGGGGREGYGGGGAGPSRRRSHRFVKINFLLPPCFLVLLFLSHMQFLFTLWYPKGSKKN